VVRLRFASGGILQGVLRRLLAKLLHLNLIDCVESFLKKEGVLNPPENLQSRFCWSHVPS